jgi:diketogulonate reductase-like aldo/keto reductase
MTELWDLAGGREVQSNQLHYSLAHRGIEANVLPWLKERRIPVMAYSPLEQSKLLGDRKLAKFAQHSDMTPAQVALAWLLARDDVIVIPKTSRRERLEENLGALDHPLQAEQLAELERLFPAPR